MSVYTLERDYLPTSNQSAEITLSQPFKEVHLDLRVAVDSQLAGTGWHSRKEIVRLFSNYNQLRKEGKSHQEALMLSVAETEINIRTYIVEYVQSKTILPHLNRLEEVDGIVRMVGKNGVSIVSGITVSERNGAVLQASQKVEDFLTDAGVRSVPNKVAVINSPLGHSGLINEKGKIINYKNNQTMVFWADEKGELHGLTIVSDLNRKQSKELSVVLGVDEALLSGATEAEEVANIVGNPALFSYGKAIADPAKYVLEKILAIRGNCDIKLEQENGADPEFRTVAQTREDIEKFESLLKFKSFWEEHLRDLRQQILAKGNKLGHPIIQTEIVRVIEEVILNIADDYLEQTKPLPLNFSSQRLHYKEAPVNRHAMAVAFLRTRAGCAGGGGGSSAILRGISFGSGGSISSISGGENINGICSECGRSSVDNHYHCDNCGKWYADETHSDHRTPECSCGRKFGC